MSKLWSESLQSIGSGVRVVTQLLNTNLFISSSNLMVKILGVLMHKCHNIFFFGHLHKCTLTIGNDYRQQMSRAM